MEKQSKEQVEERAKEVISSSDGSPVDGGDDHRLVLSGLFSQFDTLNGEGEFQQPESPVDPKKGKSEIVIQAEASGGDDSGREEIIRELKKIQKQNFVTHCLLSVMIALTVAWQLSEVTLVFKVKNGLSHPFKSFGSLLTGMMKSPFQNAQITDKDKESGTKQLQIECPSIPPLKIPELPNLDFQLTLESDKH